MTIYFTASIAGKKQYLSNYLTIIDFLKSKGHSVLADHIINTSVSDLRSEEKEEVLTFQHKLEKWILGADCVVVETSFPSISVGYEISLAYNLGKPVLILYSEGSPPPSLLAYHKDEKIVCEEYSADTLTGLLEDFVNYVRGAADMRFTFFITSKIASYLKKVSKKEKTPKSVYLRRLIEADMKNRT